MSEEKKEGGLLFEITKRINKLLNLDDQSLLQKFFVNAVKDLEQDVENLNENKKLYESQHRKALREINNQIEDAEIDIENAENGVTIDDISNKNVKQREFAKIYFARIEKAEEVLDGLTKVKENLLDEYTRETEAIDLQIQIKQRRISRIIKANA